MVLWFVLLQAASVKPAPRTTPAKVDVRAATEKEQAEMRKKRLAEEEATRQKRAREEAQRAEVEERERLELEYRATQQRVERERTALVARGAGRSLVTPGAPIGGTLNPDGTPAREGGWEHAVVATVVAGYNDNVIQTIDDPVARIVTRRGSPFLGADVLGITQHIGARMQHDLRLQVRGQHYVPLRGSFDFNSDGTINASYAGNFELSEETTATVTAMSTLSTLNSSRQTDGVVSLIDPYAPQQRTFTLTTVRGAIERRFTDRLRFVQGADITFSTILRDAAIILPDGTRVFPRGLDFVSPRFDSTLYRDFDLRNTGFVRLRYEYIYTRFLLDLTSPTPTSRGSFDTHIGEAQLGYTHLFSQAFSSTTMVGVQLSTPLPGDSDRSLLTSPALIETLAYVTPPVLATLTGSYTYGSVNPRLGFGRAWDLQAQVVATPFDSTGTGPFSILAGAQVTVANLSVSPTAGTELRTYLTSVEARYRFASHFAVTAGHHYRFAIVDQGIDVPSLWRHIVFVGLMGFTSTQRVPPPLNTFAPPLSGG